MKQPVSFKMAKDLMAKAICRETCAHMGEPPCHTVKGQWPNPNCDEPGCQALAEAALTAAADIFLNPEKEKDHADHHPT